MKSRITVLLLTVLFLIGWLTACNTKAGADGTRYFADRINSKTLQVCIDVELSNHHFPEELLSLSDFLEDFAQEIKKASGIERVSVEYLPKDGAERENAVTRLRTEIMAGGGPDVFIMNTIGHYNELDQDPAEAVFNFPEKNMEAGMFLPLDKYIGSSIVLADWSKQTNAVMNAGKTKEGQVIIPLSYTLPLTAYPREEVPHEYAHTLTMQDITDHPETAALGAFLYNAKGKTDPNSGHFPIHNAHISYALGSLADYRNEKLLYTEQELYDTIVTMLRFLKSTDTSSTNYLKADLGTVSLCHPLNLENFDADMALLPLPSITGGVSARITSYAAINRNTQYPAEAFAVIDLLMQEKMQTDSLFYNYLLIPVSGFPLHEDVITKEKPFHKGTEQYVFLEDHYFNDFSLIRENITSVSFYNKFDRMLEKLFWNCYTEYETNGSVSRETVSGFYEKMERMIGE